MWHNAQRGSMLARSMSSEEFWEWYYESEQIGFRRSIRVNPIERFVAGDGMRWHYKVIHQLSPLVSITMIFRYPVQVMDFIHTCEMWG